ncbi:MAG: radical SAM protein, partial [Gammaproteobacteria bacterium]|nr:radical SAM protein [Gammaproteobacteria bacterium]
MRLLRIFPEIVDGCNMACALCWNRNRAGSFRQMPLSTVEKVIERFGKSPKYFWYNWGEPLLYSNFHDFVEIVKGTRSTISSNFSMKLTDQHFEDLSKLANVIVSLSGMTEEVYGIYHRGGNHATVMQNIQRLVGL